MSTELDIQSSLEKSDSGTYVIPYSRLIEMPRELLESAEKMLIKLAQDNPGYEFCTSHDLFNRDVTIKWRRLS